MKDYKKAVDRQLNFSCIGGWWREHHHEYEIQAPESITLARLGNLYSFWAEIGPYRSYDQHNQHKFRVRQCYPYLCRVAPHPHCTFDYMMVNDYIMKYLEHGTHGYIIVAKEKRGFECIVDGNKRAIAMYEVLKRAKNIRFSDEVGSGRPFMFLPHIVRIKKIIHRNAKPGLCQKNRSPKKI